MSYWDGDGVPGSPHIDVQLGEQRAYFYKGDQLVGRFRRFPPASEGHNTPTGQLQSSAKGQGPPLHALRRLRGRQRPSHGRRQGQRRKRQGPAPSRFGVPGRVDAVFPARDQRGRDAPRAICRACPPATAASGCLGSWRRISSNNTPARHAGEHLQGKPPDAARCRSFCRWKSAYGRRSVCSPWKVRTCASSTCATPMSTRIAVCRVRS